MLTVMPAWLHARAAATASSSDSPATNRRAMRRIAPAVVTQPLKRLLSERYNRVARSIRRFPEGTSRKSVHGCVSKMLDLARRRSLERQASSGNDYAPAAPAKLVPFQLISPMYYTRVLYGSLHACIFPDKHQ